MTEEKNVLKDKAKTVGGKQKAKTGSRLVKFIKETFIELKKVVWPTKRQVIVNTIIVIIASILMAVFITGVDSIFSYVDNRIFLNK